MDVEENMSVNNSVIIDNENVGFLSSDMIDTLFNQSDELLVGWKDVFLKTHHEGKTFKMKYDVVAVASYVSDELQMKMMTRLREKYLTDIENKIDVDGFQSDVLLPELIIFMVMQIQQLPKEEALQLIIEATQNKIMWTSPDRTNQKDDTNPSWGYSDI